MKELTAPDLENYAHLQAVAIKWKNAVNCLGDSHNLLKVLVNVFVDGQLSVPLISVAELEDRCQLINSYLDVEQCLEAAVPLTPDEQEAIAPLYQAFLNQFEKCKAACGHSKCPPIDDFTTPCQDDVFLGFIDGNAKTWTQKLLDGQIPCLNRHQIQQLIEAWGCAIQAFVKDARETGDNDNVKPGKPETLAHFFCIRDELETLYDRLSTVVA
jgi:hypothetical protein